MKSTTLLDSVVFQLTPTRTRCDLIIIANEKKEKIASGLLTPFLAHLKTAQDQIAKGGYSILLQPDPNIDASWFTKSTMERFVRFVSTPEILERVHTIELEILQIEEAISIQSSTEIGHSPLDHQAKSRAILEDNKLTTTDSNEEKAIVLYKPGAHQPEPEPSMQEGNSKVQLLKVLENRRTALRKEQAMAFARAVAAGFDVDNMEPLVSFGEYFGAIRLRDACTRFMTLWKKKHETGQWLEIEAAEAMDGQSDFPVINASGIVLSVTGDKQMNSSNEFPNNLGKSGVDNQAGERPPIDRQVPVSPQGYFPGQYPPPMFPPWPMHSPPGAVSVYPPYPVQGMPYYQTYPANGHFYQHPYPPTEDSQLNGSSISGHRRHSMKGQNGNTESDTCEVDKSRMRTEDDTPDSHEQKKTVGRSNKKKSGMVVIRNINYITSNSKSISESESESASNSDSDNDSEDLHVNNGDLSHKTTKSSGRRGSHSKAILDSGYDERQFTDEKEADGSHWQAFQNCLLRGADEENHDDKGNIFNMEKNVKMKRPQKSLSTDPLALRGQHMADMQDSRVNEIYQISGNVSRMPRKSSDEALLSRGSHGDTEGVDPIDMQFYDLKGRRVMSRTDDFMIDNREHEPYIGSSHDPLLVSRFVHATKKADGAPPGMADESFIVPFRATSLDHDGQDDIHLDSELPFTLPNANSSGGNRMQVNYEPDALSLMPERGAEKGSSGYDPALDIDMQEISSLQEKRKKEGNDPMEGSKRPDKDIRSRVASDVSDKKKSGGPIRKNKPLKSTPLEDARARAERIRSFKADIQKMKKEKEEADLRRLEALKQERQKRIAARGGSTSTRSPAPALQTKKLPTKLSPLPHRSSKFSDSEPGSSSPLQRSKLKTSLIASNDSGKATKASKLSDDSHLGGNRLTRSASSLSESKKESSGMTPDSKASMARIRRLSEPKSVSKRSANFKANSTEAVPKQRLSDGPDSKKISAIINLDKSKAATLPELRIRKSKVPSDVTEKQLSAKEIENLERAKTSGTSQNAKSEAYRSIGRALNDSEVDNNPIVEKTVVMLEYEKPSLPVLPVSAERTGIKDQHHYDQDIRQEPEVASDYAATRAPPSCPSPVETFGGESIPVLVHEPSNVEARSVKEKDTAKVPEEAARKPYQAPHARASSLEDPCMHNSVYVNAVPAVSDVVPAAEETSKALVSDINIVRVVENMANTSERSTGKESSKGFRRLLKFGKKSHSSTSGDGITDSSDSSMNGIQEDNDATTPASSSEAYTLKSLISQDETPTASNGSQKASRHFSLFSPFRGKTNEKKLTA